MYFIDISNDIILMLNYIDMVYLIIIFNSIVDFIIRICGKKLPELSCTSYDQYYKQKHTFEVIH